MERKGYSFNEKTNQSQDIGSDSFAVFDDSNKCSVISGYRKFFLIIVLFVAGLFFRIYILDNVDVIGNSMNDSFLQGDILLVKKYKIENIQRYDVVVAKMNSQNVIKRVIGLPNDVIHIVDGIVYVNGEKVKKEFDFYTEDAGIAKEYYTLGEDEYFLMGDNRSVSVDSRKYGSVKIKNIKGIVFLRYYPFNRIKIIAHGEDRMGDNNELQNGNRRKSKSIGI